MLSIVNDGPELLSCNFWDTPYNTQGFVFITRNAGTFRLLVPDKKLQELEHELLLIKKVIIFRKPLLQFGIIDGFEIIFDDESPTPYILFLSPNSFDLLPAQSDFGREFRFSAWKRGVKKICEYSCLYQKG